jgi:HEAT repeat protein/energy-coupling factor transporter ATP-binding protein EcfA2
MPRELADMDMQPYLRAIAATYEQWWQLYTLTDAQTKTQPEPLPFDFGLMVQTVANERSPNPDNPNGQDQAKIERFPVLEGIRKSVAEYRQVLLVGRPGSGKSTTLARLLLEEAQNSLALGPPGPPILGGTRSQSVPDLGNLGGRKESETYPESINALPGQVQYIPVLVELRFWSGSIIDRIQAFFQRHDLLLDRTQIEDLLFHRRILLLMDGLNELPSEAARLDVAKFRQDYPQMSMIFTTRDLSLGGDFGLEKKLEMQPLTEAQMQAFVRSYVPEQAEVMLRQLKERLREFGQTPLLLWMLCELFRQTGRIPENLGLVFRAFTQGYENKLKQDVRIESDKVWWQPVLQQLAWVMMQGTQPTELRVAIQQEEAVRVIAQFLQDKVSCAEDFARKCLRDLEKHHLIQVGTNPKELEFRHQLIQEYYAAEALLKQLPQLADERLKQNYLNYLKWTEPLALMLALVENQTQAERVVKLAIEVDQRLASRLAGEVKPKFQEQTVSLIAALEVTDWLKIELLGETRSESAIPELLQRLEDSDSDVRKSAAEVLGKIRSEAAIPGLLQRLEDSDSDVRKSAVEALGQIGSEAAIPGLLQRLEHSNPFVRWRAAEALGQIGSESAIPELLQRLEHSNPFVRWRAAEALGQIGSESAIPELLQWLEHSDSDVRRSAADALGKIRSEAAIPGLLQCLENSDSYLHKIAADALGQLESESAIPRLLQRLEHSDPFVRGRAADMLGQLRSEAAIPELLQWLEHSDSDVRSSAADALGKIGSEAAIPGLLQRLKDSDSDVRESAAEALGKIGSEAAIPELLQRLEESDSYVRESAAEALGKIGSEAAIPGLLQRLEDSESYVCWRAAEALGKIESKKAIPGLRQRLENSDYFVPWRAAEALGENESEAVISGLLQRLEHSDSFMRWGAAEALGDVGSEAAILGLLQRLEDSNSNIRRSAADALGKITKKHANAISPHLPHLLTLIPTESGEDAHRVIRAIQENCKYYNYEIYQAYLEAQKHDQSEGQTSDSHPSTVTYNNTYNIDQAGIINTGSVSIQGNQIGEQAP